MNIKGGNGNIRERDQEKRVIRIIKKKEIGGTGEEEQQANKT